MFKKCICLILTVFMIFSVANFTVNASETQENTVIYESFETEIGNVHETDDVELSLGNRNAEGSSGGVGGSDGCLLVTATGANAQYSNIELETGTTYCISGWIKPTQTVLEGQNYLYFTFEADENIETVQTDALSLSVDEWTYFKANFEYTGKLGDLTARTVQAQLSVRLGSGVPLETVPARKIIYYLDNFSVEKQETQASDIFAEAEFLQPVLYPELETISARVAIDNEPDRPMAILASYDANGAMKSVTVEDTFPDSGAVLGVPNSEQVSYAKLFVIGQETMRSYMACETMEKKADDAFIYVDAERGTDSADGSYLTPVQTVDAGLELAKAQMTTGEGKTVNLMLKSGEHTVKKTLALDSEYFSGKNRLRVTSYGDGEAIISGGMHIPTNDWTDDDNDGIYQSYVGTGIISRQLYVNGVRATMARSDGPLTEATRIMPATHPEYNDSYGYICADTELVGYERQEEMELVFYELWSHSYCSVESITQLGDDVFVKVDPQGASINFAKGTITSTVPVYYQNALELLDEPGEWYYNKTSGILYYKPRAFENMSTADVVFPAYMDTKGGPTELISLTGTADAPVSGIEFNDVTFAYATYQLEPSGKMGFPCAQANYARYYDTFTDEDGNTTRVRSDHPPTGVVNGKNVRDISFENCTFTKLGITALNLVGAVQDCKISGNEFYDLSASAIHVGDVSDDSAVNRGQAVNPTEDKYAVKNIEISNNYIHNIGNDYLSSVGISMGFPQNAKICNNEIFDSPYCGLHIGYGWAENVGIGSALKDVTIKNNYIHHVMNDKIHDGGSIYLNGVTGGTHSNLNVIEGNYVTNQYNWPSALYFDMGSSHWLLKRNFVDISDTPYWYRDGEQEPRPSAWMDITEGYINNVVTCDNYSTTENKRYTDYDDLDTVTGHFNDTLSVDGPWPDDAQSIIDNAGLTLLYDSRNPNPLQWVSITDEYDLDIGENLNLAEEIETFSRKGTDVSLDGARIYYRSSDSTVASVNSDGIVTAVSQGIADVEISVINGDELTVLNTKLYVADCADKLVVPQTEVTMTVYSEFNIQAKVISVLGREMPEYKISYGSFSPQIANSDQSGIVTAYKKGNARIEASASINGVTQKVECSVKVQDADNPETVDMSSVAIDYAGWHDDPSYDIVPVDGGVQVTTPRFATVYDRRTFMDEWMHFKMSINTNTAACGPILRCQETEGSSCYRFVVNHGTKTLNLSRYNNDVAEPLVAEALPEGHSGIETAWGEEHIYDVVVGARNEENGVRIVAYIDGVEFINYLDTSEKAIRTQGYFGFIARPDQSRNGNPSVINMYTLE